MVVLGDSNFFNLKKTSVKCHETRPSSNYVFSRLPFWINPVILYLYN